MYKNIWVKIVILFLNVFVFNIGPFRDLGCVGVNIFGSSGMWIPNFQWSLPRFFQVRAFFGDWPLQVCSWHMSKNLATKNNNNTWLVVCFFPHIRNNNPYCLIFFRGVETTKQITILYDTRTSNMGTVYGTHIMKPSRGDTPQDWFQPMARVCLSPFGLALRRSRQGISKICIYIIYIYVYIYIQYSTACFHTSI